MMGILSWIIFGALAGWVAGKVFGEHSQGCLTNIIIGILGAFLGGFIVEFLTGDGIQFGFSLKSFAVAVLGAVLLLAIVGKSKRR